MLLFQLKSQYNTLSLILNLMAYKNNKQLKIEHLQNDRKSVKSFSTDNQTDCLSPAPHRFVSVFPHKFRFQLFQVSEQGTQISQKMSQRAVTWMITICWSKNLSQQCLWLSILLFYICKAKRRIRKDDLQLTLLTCLSLSLKMLEKQYYQPKVLAALSSNPLTATDIIRMEGKILDIVDFNLVIPHQLCQLMFMTTFSEEMLQKILMICELLMVKDYSIFMNHSKLQCIVKLVGGEEIQNQNEKNLMAEIKDLMELKQCKIIFHKYSSKIDTELVKALFF